jgi:hypothetical protein
MLSELRKRMQSENFKESFGYGLTLSDVLPHDTDYLAYDIGRCIPFVTAFSIACAITYALFFYHP